MGEPDTPKWLVLTSPNPDGGVSVQLPCSKCSVILPFVPEDEEFANQTEGNKPIGKLEYIAFEPVLGAPLSCQL